ncbi:PIN domain-containing protein [Dyadobacter jiangsuensis]|jgi:predicted nucleic acid-binding protein|uniref:PIN domain-containing protein n=1 Tax=Dyadobacter fermentans TaxID=94254 RepID=UPI001CC07DDD|nr:PIN domain-containing protein [Dyadobacter fermentans]MBZ1359921.1 PIN domain-containing protein [Dyadobacter fermentans]
MTLTNTFLDSNVILYLFDTHPEKREIAKRLIRQNPHINAQVLVEVGNVCWKRLRWTKHEVTEFWYEMMSDCKMSGISEYNLAEAIYLTQKYDFQLFDAIIVSGALEAGCSVLYSEDMQHLLIVEEQLTIINPFFDC